ncbi:B12-binding domain-containing protein [Tateyamaria sp. Alg231-49]|uniref:cobalamin B12-binding domain-containing protein n=1 Tax=Tateyamaria sp. Alg231-49 TaxID=1922219 RepID=UPI00131F1B07|nr:cobalamin B12-binding domain-containing protein [Tateyamaria sp. Alg231-49]
MSGSPACVNFDLHFGNDNSQRVSSETAHFNMIFSRFENMSHFIDISFLIRNHGWRVDLTMKMFGAARRMGGLLSQHQQTFLAADTSEVALIARRALSMLASGTDSLTPRPQTPSLAAVTQALFERARAADAQALPRLLNRMKRAGHTGQDIAFDLIPEVSKRLGTAWERDEISFTDVTISCARLQNAVRHLTDDVPQRATLAQYRARDCLVLLPDGAQHTLGAIILAQQLRHAGLRVRQELNATPETIQRLAKAQIFDIVFISASLSETSDIVRDLASTSQGQWIDTKVILGGTFLNHGPADVAATGVKHVTQSWREALNMCS